jgi:2-oxoglutarate ferredoxin oxidoreductase subunit alpha
MDRLAKKFETARTLVPRPEIVRNDGNQIGIIAYGTSHHALVETLDQLQAEYGVKADYLRLRAFPFTRETHEFIAAHKRVYIVDQNRDAQMLELLKLDIAIPDIIKLRSVRHYNGLPIDARSVTDEIISQEGK